jgi:YD repeat-containing protein
MKNVGLKTIGTLFRVLMIMLLCTSCQKEITGDIGTEVSTGLNKIRSYTQDYTSGTTHEVATFNLSYDAQDRVTNIVTTSSPGDRLEFVYDADSNYTMDLYNNNVLEIHEKFFVNSLAKVDSSIQYNRTDTSTEKYLYNANKQLITLKSYHYSSLTGSTLTNVTNYTYDNLGNVTRETNALSTISYDYYPDYLNNIYSGLIYFDESANLLKTTNYTLGSSKETTNHTYTFDAKKRVSSEKAETTNGEVVVKTYNYF